MQKCKTIRFAFLFLLIPVVGPAQEKTPLPGEARGNPIGNIFSGNYKEPQVRSFDALGETTLDSMSRDGKVRLSAEDAVRLALENNVDINVERYSPYFSLWGIEKGRAVLNPSILFNGNVNRLVTPTTSPLQGGNTLLNLASNFDLTVHKPFEPGLDLDVVFNSQRLRSSSFFNSINPSFTSAISVSFTQHLLKDFGRTTRGRFLRIARNNYDISQEAFIARTSEIVTNTLNAYWDLVFSEEDIRVKEASKKLAEVVLEQNKIQAEVGTMAPLDVVQAEAEVAARNEQLVVARYNKRITEDRLRKLLSSDEDPGNVATSLEPVSAPDPPPPPPTDAAGAIQRALADRPEIKQLLKDLDNRQIEIDFTRNQLLPTFDLVARYSQNGLGGRRIVRDYSEGIFGAPIIGIESGGFFDSLDALFSRKYLGYFLGFSLRIPIGNDEARANSAQAQIGQKQTLERLRSQRQVVALEVRQAYDNIEMNRAQVEAAQATIRYQERRLQGEQDKYALGATTTRFILEAQRDLQDAQTRLLQASIALIKSHIALEKAMGGTFAAHNIELEKALKPLK